MATTQHAPSRQCSLARVSGGLVSVSGALSLDPDGRAVGGRQEAVVAALWVLEDRLAMVDATLGDVVKLTCYVDDITLRDEVEAHLLTVFDAPGPARTFVQVSRLPYRASIEIDAIARCPCVPAFPA